MERAFPRSVSNAGLSAADLTTSFDDNSFVIDLRHVVRSGQTPVDDKSHLFNTLTLYLEYALATGETNNDLEIQIEVGPDEDSLHLATAATVSGGTITLAPAVYTFTGASDAAPYKISFPVDISERYIKVSFRESSAVSAGTLTAKYLLSKR